MKRFVLFSPDYKDDWFYKDGAQLIVQMKKFEFAPEVLVFDHRRNFPISEEKLIVSKIDPHKFNWGNLTIFFYLLKNAKSIKVFMCYHVNFSSLFQLFAYKIFNPAGFAYLKMDNNHRAIEKYGWETIWEKRVAFWKIKKVLMKFVFIKKINLFSIEDNISKDYFEEKYPFLKDKLILLYNGFTAKKEEYTQIVWSEKKNYILSVARFGIYEKATEVLLEAFANTKTRHNWKLILCGTIDPGFEKYVTEYFKKHSDLKERVLFTGHLIRNELFDFYRQAKIFALPSRSEGFPNAISDALFFKNAIITTNRVAINDLFNNKMGIVINPDNVKELEDAMSSLILNEELVKKYGEEAQRFAARKLDWSLNATFLYNEMRERGLRE